MILKNKNSIYMPNNRTNWVKLKKGNAFFHQD